MRRHAFLLAALLLSISALDPSASLALAMSPEEKGKLDGVQQLLLQNKVDDAAKKLSTDWPSLKNVSYAWELQSRVHQARKEYTKGLNAVREAQKLDRNKPELPLIEAFFLIKLKRTREYDSCYARFFKMLDPARSEHELDLAYYAYCARARERIANHSYSKAMQDLDQAIKLKPGRKDPAATAQLQVIECLMLQKRMNEAYDKCVQTKKLLPDSQELNTRLAGVLVSLGRLNESLPILARLCSNYPSAETVRAYALTLLEVRQYARADDVLSNELRQRPNSDLLFLRARVRFLDKQTGKALEDFERLNKHKTNLEYLSSYISALTVVGKHDKIVELCTGRLQLSRTQLSDNDRARLLSLRSSGYALGGNWKRVIEDLKSKQQLKKALTAEEQQRMITALLKSGKASDAIRQCEIAIEKFPADGVLRQIALHLHKSGKNRKAAIADIDALAKLKPPNVNELLEVKAQMQLQEGDLEGAVQTYTSAMLMNAKDKKHLYLARAEVFYKQSKLDSALADASKSIEMDCTDPLAYYLRADIYEKMGNDELALENQKRADSLVVDQAKKR